MNSPRATLVSNFAQLAVHDEQLLRIGMLAERYFAEDPNTCLLKLRQFAEVLAQLVAANMGLYDKPEQSQRELLGRLRDNGILPREIYQLFNEIRRAGNAANHSLAGDRRNALSILKIAWQLGIWFHRTFKDPKFKSGPFTPPQPPKDETEELRSELSSLSEALARHQAAHQQKDQQLQTMEAQLKASKDDQSFWEQMASEVETEKAELEKRLAAKQAATAKQPKTKLSSLLNASNSAATHIHLDEAETRQIIDAQLRQAGWIADTANLRYSKGARPQKGKNMAIAEWPTATGPADYVLFVGLTPLAAVEAKRKNKNVSAYLQQAKRYSRGFNPSDETTMHQQNWGADGEFRIPFVFSSNGRPYLRQLATHSGIWFCDLRRPDNLGDVLQGWHSPEGLMALLNRDEAAAHRQLATESFSYGFTIRDYQKSAILETEKAVAEGKRQGFLKPSGK